MNILVGDNNEGKSTILEAKHLCLTGIFRGKYLRNNLTQEYQILKEKEEIVTLPIE